jgi:sugar/nucleoside kinase (ribokinase family)
VVRGGPNIVFVGHITIDHNITEGDRYESWGSPAIYMARFVRQNYKLTSTILTRRGRDFACYEDGLHFMPRAASVSQTLVYENTVRHGVRTQRSFHTQTATVPRLTAAAKKVLAAADIVVVAPLLANYSAAFVERVLAATSAGCIKILSPQGYFRQVAVDAKVHVRNFSVDEAQNIFQHFDVVVYSDEDYPEAIAHSCAWGKATPRVRLVVTQNSRGATIIHNDDLTHVPTVPVPTDEVVDSVGCGDIFTMALALSFWRDQDFLQAVRAGHAAARAKLTTPRFVQVTPSNMRHTNK